MNILAFESSCDETSVSLLENEIVLSNVISSQYFHRKYGGVVPELASRAHIQKISELTQEALKIANKTINEIDAFAVTTQPGLIGSLMVGSGYAKALSLKYNKPIIPVNHIEGHLYSGCLQDSTVEFPQISLVVSGGHTSLFLVNSFQEYKVIGSTKDDAAGEAFDKIAKMMGIEYPGGPILDKLAQNGNPLAFDFPRSMINSPDFDFSFSGLKTSVRYFLQKNYPNGIPEEMRNDFAASVQAAIVDVLTAKTIKAAKQYKVSNIVIGGGVSANSYLRKMLSAECEKRSIKLVLPQMSYCVDNAAMIGYIAAKKLASASNNTYNNYKFTVSANALRA